LKSYVKIRPSQGNPEDWTHLSFGDRDANKINAVSRV